MVRIVLIGIAVARIAAIASPAAAQSARVSIRGVVTNERNNARLANAAIELRAARDASAILASALTDADGRFALDAPRGDGYVLSVRRLGFAPYSTSLDSLQREIAIAMQPVATLDAMQVTAPSPALRWLAGRGYFERQHEMSGTFIDSATIARRQPTSLLSLLRPYLKGCTMIFVDGIPAPLQGIDPSEVMAIEIYNSNLAAPPQFHNPAERGPIRCGSIVVWRIV